MQKYQVGSESSGVRLDLFLAETSGLSRSAAQAELKSGLVEVNEAKEKSSYLVKDGDEVSWRPAKPARIEAPDLPIIYEDDDVVVIDKPAGLLSHAVSLSRPESSVAEFARSRVEDNDPLRPGIVHRLDKDTSGLMVIAKHKQTRDYLKHLFQTGGVEKTYLTLVEGVLEPAQAIIRLPIAPSKDYEKRTVKQGGKEAVTKYRVLQYLPGYTLVQAKPETGRTHQIRVHFAHLKHPVAGDTLYGAKKRPTGLSRQFLHAARLSFELPSGKFLEFKSELPDDLQGFLEHLEKQYN